MEAYNISSKAKIKLKAFGGVTMADDKMNTRDCLQRAWMNTMELVRDFEMYSKRIDDEEVSELFKRYAEEQGMQANNLREMYNKHS